MISAIDSSVIFDLLVGEARAEMSARSVVRAAPATGAVVACDVVWAEVSAHFASVRDASLAIARFQIAFDPTSAEAALAAGRAWRAWRAYRLRGGPRDHLIPDFLVGAHALVQADRLLTRDSAFQRRNFPELAVIDPREA